MSIIGKAQKALRRTATKAVSATLSQSVAKQLGQEMVTTLEAWTQHWRNAPKFSAATAVTGSGDRADICITIMASGTDRQLDIYRFMDSGTAPHIITARSAQYLKFKSRYRRALQGSRPNYFSPGPASRSGPVILIKTVVHPGIPPRSLTRSAYEVSAPAVLKSIRGAIVNAIAAPNISVEVEYK